MEGIKSIINGIQRARLFGKLAKLQETGYRGDYATLASDGRTASIADLTAAEADDVIVMLDKVENGLMPAFNPHRNTPTVPATGNYSRFDFMNTKHKYILSICHQLGWTVYNEEKKRSYVCMVSLSEWLKKYGYLHKPLMQYSDTELTILISQLEKIKPNAK